MAMVSVLKVITYFCYCKLFIWKIGVPIVLKISWGKKPFYKFTVYFTLIIIIINNNNKFI